MKSNVIWPVSGQQSKNKDRWQRSDTIFPALYCHKCILSAFCQQLICFHTNSIHSVPRAPSMLFCKHTCKHTHTHICTDKSFHIRTLSQNQSVQPDISHSSVLVLFTFVIEVAEDRRARRQTIPLPR